MTPELKFHHVGLAVKNPEAAQKFLLALGYQLLPPLYDPLQCVNLRMCTHPAMPHVELIWSAETGAPSPVGNLLKNREGLVYHLCYSSNNVAGALAGMEKLGLRILPLGEAKPAVLFEGLCVSFYEVRDMGLIEIIHTNSA